MFGVSIGPPYEDIAENPTSSSTAKTTFGDPSGAFGGSNGDQSGTESRMSTSILPLNGSLIVCSMVARPCVGTNGHRECSTAAHPGTSPDRGECARPHPLRMMQAMRGRETVGEIQRV